MSRLPLFMSALIVLATAATSFADVPNGGFHGGGNGGGYNGGGHNDNGGDNHAPPQQTPPPPQYDPSRALTDHAQNVERLIESQAYQMNDQQRARVDQLLSQIEQEAQAQPQQNQSQVCFYVDGNYGGASFCLHEGDSIQNLDGYIAGGRYGWNDTISSVWIQGRLQVDLFRDANFQGMSMTATQSVVNFNALWNDAVSSIRVR